ncbi:DUF418 domain-containing protein [Bacillus horti]|uniref:DUF418 domain-containing protein n=1 Tax=Caldalkalibacillus horti TaxID=77523 RepID=UPI0035212BBD
MLQDHIPLLKKIGQKPAFITKVLAAAGKRSLTCYVLQSALIAILLSEPLIGLGGRIDKVHNQ